MCRPENPALRRTDPRIVCRCLCAAIAQSHWRVRPGSQAPLPRRLSLESGSPPAERRRGAANPPPHRWAALVWNKGATLAGRTGSRTRPAQSKSIAPSLLFLLGPCFGNQRRYGPVFLREILAGDTLDVGWGHCFVGFFHPVELAQRGRAAL